jgi:hypothetical protein
MKKLLLLFILTLTSFESFSQFSTSFESSEGFILGPTPQGAWGNTTLATNREISNEYASDGLQSLKLSGNNGTVHTRAGVVSSTNEVTAGIVEVKFKFYYVPAADQTNGSDFYFAPQSPNESTVVTFYRFAFDQKIYAVDNSSGSAAFTDTGYTFEFNQWYDCKIVIDFANSNIDYYLDNTIIFSAPTWSTATKVGNLAITNDNFESSAYFDEISYFDPSLQTSQFSENLFSVFPNPTKDIVNVSNTSASINSIEVTDLNGRVVKTVNAIEASNAQVNISDLSSGVYMMKIVSDQGTTTKKVIKK